MDWANVLVALLAGVFSGSTIGSIYSVRANRRTKDATAGDIVASAALKLLEPYQKQVQSLQEQVDRLIASDRDKSQRIQSLENDGRVTRAAMMALETQHRELQGKMGQWHEGIQILIKQVEKHDSKPDWKPDGE